MADGGPEHRVSLGGMRVEDYLSRLADKVPAPGGGAVAAMTGATAASLTAMVVRYSLGRKALAEHEAFLNEACDRLDRASHVLVSLGDADAEAYAGLNAAMKLDRADPQRARRVMEGAREAVLPPRATMAASMDLLRLMEDLATRTNRNLWSDLAIGAMLAASACHAGSLNVRANLPLLDEAERGVLEAECERSETEATERRTRILTLLSMPSTVR